MSDTTEIAKVGIELAGRQLPGVKVARNYTYGEWHKWNTYFDNLILQNSDNKTLHFVEVSGTAAIGDTQDAVMAITGNGPTSAEHAAFIVHACNNFETLAKRALNLEAELAAAQAERELLVAVAEAAGVFEHFLSKSGRAPGALQRTLTAWRER